MKKNFFVPIAVFMIAMLSGVFVSCSSDDEPDSKYNFSAGNYDFEVNGIYYDLTSLNELTCIVVNGKEEYKGDIVLPSTVNYNGRVLTVVGIGNRAFYGCSQLTGITIPNTITSIADFAFEGCYKLERINIEDGETVLNMGHGPQNPNGDGTNAGLFYLDGDNSPSLRLYIGRNLDYNNYTCSPFLRRKIKELTIGNFVTAIEDFMFQETKGLTNVIIPNSVTKIGRSAFLDCSDLVNVTIPNSVVEIGNNAFEFCFSLTNVIIPNSVTKIGEYAFGWCSSLTNVTVGNSVTKIGNKAFYFCTGLVNVTLGSSVTEIGHGTFSGCDSLTELYSLNTTPPIHNTTPPDVVSGFGFTKNQYMTLNVYVPNEALEAYQSAEEWKDFWNLQGSDFTE